MIDDGFLKELQEMFLLDAEDLLGKAESLFLDLEKNGSMNKDTLDQIKRLAHNFKGGGKTAGFDDLSRFCHCFENLLVSLSSGAVPLTGEMIDLLLQCNDALKQDIAHLKNDLKYQVAHPELERKLIAVVDGAFQASDQKAPASDDGMFEKSIEQIASELGLAHGGQANAAPSAQAAVPKTQQVEKKSERGPGAPISKDADESIRVPLKKIDELLNAFGEQLIFLSALDHYKESLEENRDSIYRAILSLKKVALDLQQSTLTLRMVNLKSTFSKLERSIRDAGKATGKKVNCLTTGAEQELDKSIVDQLADPLMHMVRNAVDHGLESSEERVRLGKSESGNIRLIARREGGSFVIEIHDDGKGLDPEKLRQKAISKNIISPTAHLSEKECLDLIFENGFSTKEEVSELSGRGVGMNVVKEMVVGLKGSIEIDTKVGHGTCFRMRLPLSLSLFNGMLVDVNSERFVIPSSQVIEIVDLKNVEVRALAGGQKVIQLRESIVELVGLPHLLVARKAAQAAPKVKAAAQGEAPKTKEMVLISEVQGKRVGFLIHQILGIIRVVQKPLSGEMTVCPGAAGVTILGDGMPAIILDLREIWNGSPQTARASFANAGNERAS